MPLFKILNWSKTHLLQNTFFSIKLYNLPLKKSMQKLLINLFHNTIISEKKSKYGMGFFVGLISSNNTSF